MNLCLYLSFIIKIFNYICVNILKFRRYIILKMFLYLGILNWGYLVDSISR